MLPLAQLIIVNSISCPLFELYADSFINHASLIPAPFVENIKIKNPTAQINSFFDKCLLN